MHFLFVTDVGWWALGRTAKGLEAYHNTEHTWHTCTQDRLRFFDRLNDYDAIVAGSLPAYLQAVRRCPVPPRPKLIVTAASFRDASLKVLQDQRGALLAIPQENLDRIDAFIINDPRQAPMLLGEGRPLILHTDRTDGEVFCPKAPRTPKGPMRVGWAGSDANWMGVKHLCEIQQAVKHQDIELVLQRREVEGVKNADGMADWFRSLDLYISANEELTPTPVPVLEAIACGVPALTTRCGCVWPLIHAVEPGLILEGTSVQDIGRGLSLMSILHRSGQLGELGCRLSARVRPQITWQQSGAAEQLTRSLEALCQKK